MTTATPGRAAGTEPPQVRLSLPDDWSRLPVDPGGDKRGQQEWLDRWLADHGVGPDEHPIAREDVVRRLTSTSRRASRAGVAFAAVLLELVRPAAGEDAPAADAGPAGALILAASLTLAFRTLPGATDPAVAATGILESLQPDAAGPGAGHYSTQKLELIGLAGDRTRPAVLREDSVVSEEGGGLRVQLAEVLWLVPGYSQLAVLSVTTLNRELRRAFVDVALAVAGGLSVDRPPTDA